MAPSAESALKELARHIGDRDNAVRSAALNCVASAYFLEGEKVYKMIGQISDKDLSLFEERIKRASKTRSAEARRSMVVPLSALGKPIQQPIDDVEPPRRTLSHTIAPPVEYEEEVEEEEELPPPIVHPVIPEPKVISGPFGLDPELIARLDAAVPVLKQPNLLELDLKFLDEPIPAGAGRPHTAIAQPIRSSVVPMSPPRHMAPHPIVSTATPASSVDDSQLADIIHSIASRDLTAAIRALSLISRALASGRGTALVAYEQRLVSAIAAQVKRLRTGAHTQDMLPVYKYIVGALTNFYETAGCGSQVGEPALCAVLGELLRVLDAGSNAGGAGSDAERLVRVLNNICGKVLERSPRTPLLCAIVSLLHESIGVSDPAYPRYQDLLLKCFWKTLKMISSWDVNSVDYDAVLYKIHLFYKAYPDSYWKKNPDISDTPYRTVKTLVHTLVKMKGASITNHLTQIPDVNESDLYPYLLKVLKQFKLDEKKENTTEPINGSSVLSAVSGNTALNAGRLPRASHEELALILKRIGTKEHNKAALEQLYDLRERHPEVDIWTLFRNFVERGLREVADQRKLASMPIYKHDYNKENIDITNENDEKSHVMYLERLRVLQDYMERIGMDVRVQCIVCDWAGPKIILEYHIKKEHPNAIQQQDGNEWSVLFTLGELISKQTWSSQLLQHNENVYAISAKYNHNDTLMISLSIIPYESETEKRGQITVYNRISGKPYTFEGEIKNIPISMPYEFGEECLELDIGDLDLIPNSANLRLVNRELVGSPSKVIVGQPELNSLEIVVYAKLLD